MINIENLGKRYRITSNRDAYVTLREKISNPFKSIRDNLLKKNDDFWALNGVTLKINQGEVMGLIGPNGSGKSTLLKIISRITSPTIGKITIRGRVASLLEVGTGFHSELSGRENIYLSGVILGMSKKEIDLRFDEIVDFSGIKRFLDTPVKRYSSGMMVRLGFSVAAHLNADILLVDEVLAVGDAEFQNKCLNKLNQIVGDKHRTVIFISHDMSAIRRLCSRVALLDRGKLVLDGPVDLVVNRYLNGANQSAPEIIIKEDNHKLVQIKKIVVRDKKDNNKHFDVLDEVYVEVDYYIREDLKQQNHVALMIYDNGALVINSYDVDSNPQYYSSRQAGEYKTVFKIPSGLMNKGTYQFVISCGIYPKYNTTSYNAGDYFDSCEAIFINYYDSNSFAKNFYKGIRGGSILLKLESTIIKK